MFSSKNGECKIYYCWFAFSSQPQICFSRIIILQNELTSEKACRVCSTIICPVSTNGIVVVWYLLNLPQVANSSKKFWELWQGKICFILNPLLKAKIPKSSLKHQKQFCRFLQQIRPYPCDWKTDVRFDSAICQILSSSLFYEAL